tara:strand:+ start:4193 stop:5290 length:1098 start_codon:yes stop_codon:yes gene_type:complete
MTQAILQNITLPVSQPFMPPYDELELLLKQVYDSRWLTNDGPMLKRLEKELMLKLGVNQLAAVTNGTIALQLAIKTLGLKGKVITTPFSYVASVSSLVWEGCEPVFVDIEPNGFNIDPEKIEAAITPEVTGILATHCFGIPCDVGRIQEIADEHGLKIIYDGAHAFGSTVKGKSIFNFGDISTCSMHATKLMHSGEGGFVVTQKHELLYRVKQQRSFGHSSVNSFDEVGINGKNSELHAALGLANMRHCTTILERREQQCHWYQERLGNTKLELPDVQRSDWNFSYYPIVFSGEKECTNTLIYLRRKGVEARRYFHPALNTVSLWRGQPCARAESVSKRVLCLPLFHELSEDSIDFIAQLVRECL